MVWWCVLLRQSNRTVATIVTQLKKVFGRLTIIVFGNENRLNFTSKAFHLIGRLIIHRVW